MKHCFNVQVVGKNLYNQDAERTPIPFGALDNRMGTSQKVVFDNDISFPSARTPINLIHEGAQLQNMWQRTSRLCWSLWLH